MIMEKMKISKIIFTILGKVKIIISNFCSTLRVLKLRFKGIKVGERTSIGSGCNIYGNIKIGFNTSIVSRCTIAGNVEIGSNVIIAADCKIISKFHQYENTDAIPYGTNYKNEKIFIHDNVWLGENVIVLPGVIIEEGSIIGIGTIVTKKVPKCSIVVGNPGRVIKTRNIEEYEKLKKNKRFLNDIRGKSVVGYIEKIKYNFKINRLLKMNNKVFEKDILSNEIKARYLLFNYAQVHKDIELDFNIEEGYCLIRK